MKKIFRILIAAAVLCAVTTTAVYAAPYRSFVRDRDGMFRFSPSLYEPSRVINYDLNGVNEVFVGEDDWIYAARTGTDASEVVVFDAEENFVKSIGADALKSATGLFVSESAGEKLIYVVDYQAAKIFVFDFSGATVKEYTRPTSPLFGASTPFKPSKVAVDRQGGLYVISEGATGGIVQMNADGEFLGYFGVNVSYANFFRSLQKKLFSEEMMANFIRNAPPSMSNIAIDDKGIVYATTKGDANESLKKINIAGKNLFGAWGGAGLNFESVASDADGNVYAVSGATGEIVITDPSGDIVGVFGSKAGDANGDLRLGLTVAPVSVAVNSKRVVYIADKGTGQIVSFTPTPLMSTLFKALKLYKEGFYAEGEPLWNEVLSRNTSVAIAYDALGMSRLKTEDYNAAMNYFKLANNRKLYSDAFWEARQEFMLGAAQYVIIFLAALIFLSFVLRKVDERTDCLGFYRSFKGRVKRTRGYKEYNAVAGVLRHPLDSFYNVRRYEAVTIWSAIGLYALTAVVLLAGDYFIGFAFNPINTDGWWYNPGQKLLNMGLFAGLFLIANFLITSIRDGRGKFRHIFKGTALCLAPIVFLYVPFIVVSNVLTLQESFIFTLFRYSIFGWSGLLVLAMINEIHDYEFKETLKCAVLTVFAMAVIFVVCVVVYILGKETVTFFKSIIEEALRHGSV